MAASRGEDRLRKDEDRLRKDMLDDRRFRLGRLGDEAFQWPQKVWQRRKSQGRPVLQTNRMLAFVALARNAVLSANLRPHVQPVDDKADVKTAEVISALIRNTEHLSQVEAVYSTARTACARTCLTIAAFASGASGTRRSNGRRRFGSAGSHRGGRFVRGDLPDNDRAPRARGRSPRANRSRAHDCHS